MRGQFADAATLAVVGNSPILLTVHDLPVELFKQVCREVNVLTEAGRQTEVYSIRFAARILRQHQFKATDFASNCLSTFRQASQLGNCDQSMEIFRGIQGKLNKYAIYLGSSDIQMRPSNRYLRIVPGRSEAGSACLPFAGDEKFSVILSKAVLPLDDYKITDKQFSPSLGNSGKRIARTAAIDSAAEKNLGSLAFASFAQ